MRTHTRSSTRQGGFTLMEMMVVLAVTGVILGLAIPNMRDFIRNNRLSGGANDLLAALNLARTEAIKRQLAVPAGVAVCPSANPKATTPTCSGAWSNSSSGWVVWVDANGDWALNAGEAVLAAYEPMDSSVTLRSDNNGVVRYTLTGFASPADGVKTPSRNVVMCDARGTTTIGGSSAARLVQISATGRARASKIPADLSAALSTIGSTCP